MKNTMVAVCAALACWNIFACAAPDEATEEPELGTLRAALGAERGPSALQVAFADCSEVASLATVPFAGARAVVPEAFTITGDGTSAVVVVRAAHCGAVQLEHARPRPATVAQLGVNLSGADGGPGPDASADINNYTVFFATDDARLAQALRQFGVDAAYDPLLRYTLDDDAAPEQLSLAVHRPREGRYRAQSSVVPSAADAVTYVASWWAEGARGTVQMRSVFPAIRFGGSQLTLRAKPGSDLADLLGTTEPSFDLFDSFNTFDSAASSVTLSERAH